jgi:predicted enzyme related to lactoylglutathione lyase
MPETAVSAPGKAIWVDLATPDIAKSKDFYSKLFGWTPQELGPEAGGYVMFALNGKTVAAAAPAQEGQFPAWSVYFGTEDADATARAVESAGGKVIVPPFDVLNSGRMAVFQGPEGAFFSVWQPKNMKGFDVINEPNTFSWAELNTKNTAAAEGFYPKVFGWGMKKAEASENAPAYTEWQVAGESIGGAMDTTSFQMEVPPFWLVYFMASDIDAAASKVKELGGQVMNGPSDYPGGKFAVVMDPNNTVFGILQAVQQ